MNVRIIRWNSLEYVKLRVNGNILVLLFLTRIDLLLRRTFIQTYRKCLREVQKGRYSARLHTAFCFILYTLMPSVRDEKKPHEYTYSIECVWLRQMGELKTRTNRRQNTRE